MAQQQSAHQEHYPSRGGAGGGRGSYTYIIEPIGANTIVYDHVGGVAHGPGASAPTEINWAITNS